MSAWPLVRVETVGQSPTVWIRDPDQPNTAAHYWLFKPVEIHTDGSRRGGDWAEKASSELAAVLQIPTATIELASRDGVEGSISLNVRPVDYDMHSGRLWMDADKSIAYVAGNSSKSKRVRGASPGYTLDGIETSLADVGPPPDHASSKDLSGFGVFAGYLVLDALLANRDRHEENWSVLIPTAGEEQVLLSNSYDLAGSLGYQLTDEFRERALAAKDVSVPSWVEKGDAWRFDSQGSRVTLVELARVALERAGKGAELHWLSKVGSLSRADVELVFARLTEMSDVGRRFASEVVMTNAERIL